MALHEVAATSLSFFLFGFVLNCNFRLDYFFTTAFVISMKTIKHFDSFGACCRKWQQLLFVFFYIWKNVEIAEQNTLIARSTIENWCPRTRKLLVKLESRCRSKRAKQRSRRMSRRLQSCISDIDIWPPTRRWLLSFAFKDAAANCQTHQTERRKSIVYINFNSSITSSTQ